MGMDVYGKKPTSPEGEYFRNNVWWWHPLWEYCCYVQNDLVKRVPYAHENSGDGLGSVASRKLGLKLQETINTGEAQKYVDSYYDQLKTLPDEPCFCIKKSLYEVFSMSAEIPFPKLPDVKSPNPECNTCKGTGMQPNWSKNYHIDVDNIQKFSNFLIACGGFQIC